MPKFIIKYDKLSSDILVMLWLNDSFQQTEDSDKVEAILKKRGIIEEEKEE